MDQPNFNFSSPPRNRWRRRGRKKPAKFRVDDRVRTLAAIEEGESLIVPAGSIGTIVTRWAHGLAFEIEFMGVVTALVTVEPRVLELVERETG